MVKFNVHMAMLALAFYQHTFLSCELERKGAQPTHPNRGTAKSLWEGYANHAPMGAS